MNTDLPFTADERLTKMFDMMYDIFNNFFSGRTLKVKIPKVSSDDAMRALDEGKVPKSFKSSKFKLTNVIFWPNENYLTIIDGNDIVLLFFISIMQKM